MGDAGVMSGLIAKNHDELEVLKHRGDRNYYEFTLQKGAQPTLLSTHQAAVEEGGPEALTLHAERELGRQDIEKKDKGLDEPVQFYTGKDPVLYRAGGERDRQEQGVGISFDSEGR